jgi:hypothetical protein
VLALLEKQSIADFTSNLTVIVVLATFAIFSLKVNSLTARELNESGAKYYLFVIQMLVPNLLGLAVCCVYYKRCRPLRDKILREIREFLDTVCNSLRNRIYAVTV